MNEMFNHKIYYYLYLCWILEKYLIIIYFIIVFILYLKNITDYA